MIPGTYIMPHLYKNDTYNGTQFQIKDFDTDVAIDLTGATILVEFRKDTATGTVQKACSIGSGITVTDEVEGTFIVDPFNVGWPVGLYYYDVEVTFPSGVIKTYIAGTVNVIQDVTDV